jgi:phosphonopyruvate decarboxylase
MGKASSLALGLALAQPDKRVIVFDGDGSLLMNLGSLVTIADKAPENLFHFVMENGVYAVTGGQPVPANGMISWADLAEAAGYNASFEFDDLEDFATRAEEVFSSPGPVFICVKSVPEVQNEPIGKRVRPVGIRSTNEAMDDLRQSLGTK